MPYFFCPPENISGNKFYLPESESHHLRDVLRKRSGDSIKIFDGKGNIFDAIILSLNPKQVSGEIISTLARKQKISPKSCFYVSIPKNQKIDGIIDKLSQLGISELHPIISARTIARHSNIELKLKRWSGIALSASKQSGRPDVMEIFLPIEYSKAIKNVSAEDLNIIAWEVESNYIKNVLIPESITRNINIFVGPEGGFSPEEVDAARALGFKTAGLGENILKTELASVYIASLIADLFMQNSIR